MYHKATNGIWENYSSRRWVREPSESHLRERGAVGWDGTCRLIPHPDMFHQRVGNGVTPTRGSTVTVHCTGFGKNRDLSVKVGCYPLLENDSRLIVLEHQGSWTKAIYFPNWTWKCNQRMGWRSHDDGKRELFYFHLTSFSLSCRVLVKLLPFIVPQIMPMELVDSLPGELCQIVNLCSKLKF